MAFGEAVSSRDAKLTNLVEGMDRRIRHHLRLARAAAMGGSVRARVELVGVVDDLAMVLARMHADKAIAFDTDLPAGLAVPCDRQDFEEMLGSLIENACRWCAGRVRVHALMRAVWPQLAEVRVTHCWSGKVGMTADKLAHLGRQDGTDFAVGCNGNGVALMTYLGHQAALKLLGRQNRPSAFDSPTFAPVPVPFYDGRPWFLPVVSGWYHLRDAIEHRLARP